MTPPVGKRTRAEKVAEAQRLRGEGLKLREIGERMGCATSTVSSYLHDPDGFMLKARKDSYRGICKSCGGPTCGGGGRAKAPEHCKNCAPTAYAKWSRERIIAKAHEWAESYGAPPTTEDWNPGIREYMYPGSPRALEMRERYESDDWPSTTSALDHFGSWNTMITAAGFAPLPQGGGRRRKPYRSEVAR